MTLNLLATSLGIAREAPQFILCGVIFGLYPASEVARDFLGVLDEDGDIYKSLDRLVNFERHFDNTAGYVIFVGGGVPERIRKKIIECVQRSMARVWLVEVEKNHNKKNK